MSDIPNPDDIREVAEACTRGADRANAQGAAIRSIVRVRAQKRTGSRNLSDEAVAAMPDVVVADLKQATLGAAIEMYVAGGLMQRDAALAFDSFGSDVATRVRAELDAMIAAHGFRRR